MKERLTDQERIRSAVSGPDLELEAVGECWC